MCFALLLNWRFFFFKKFNIFFPPIQMSLKPKWVSSLWTFLGLGYEPMDISHTILFSYREQSQTVSIISTSIYTNKWSQHIFTVQNQKLVRWGSLQLKSTCIMTEGELVWNQPQCACFSQNDEKQVNNVIHNT